MHLTLEIYSFVGNWNLQSENTGMAFKLVTVCILSLGLDLGWSQSNVGYGTKFGTVVDGDSKKVVGKQFA